MDEQLLNCVQEICCAPAAGESAALDARGIPKASEKAIAALIEAFKRGNCHNKEDCARLVLEHFTLAPRSFLLVKQEFARLARG